MFGGSQGVGTVYSLDAGLAPFVSLQPFFGKRGTKIEILGQGLTGAVAVSFNGVSAKYKVISDTLLTTVVPKGAGTGYVTVTTPGGTLISNRIFSVP
jgi:hypothetical protein